MPFSLSSSPWERWLMLAAALVCLTLAAGWGLPGRSRVELIQPRPFSAAERAAMTAVRQAKNEEREGWLNTQSDRMRQGQRVSIFRNEFDAGSVLTRDEKLYAASSYLLGGSAHDEAQTYHALSSMRPARLDFDPHIYIYGGAYLYPLGAALFAMRAVGLIHVTGQYDYYLDHPESIARLYLAGRWMNILAFLGILWLLGRLGERAGGRLTAALAMLAWLVSTQALDQALISKPHLYAAFWTLLAIERLAGREGPPRRRDLLIAALAAGWALGASLPCFLVFLPLAALLIDPAGWRVSFRRLAFAGGVMALTFALTNPYDFLRWQQFRVTLQGHGTSGGYGYGVVALTKLLAFSREIFTRGYGFPVSLAGLVALVWLTLRREGWLSRLAGATLLMTFICGSSVAVSRIVLFIGPLVCLYAGLGLARLWRRADLSGAPARIFCGLFIGLLFVPAVFFAGLFMRDAIADQAWLAPMRAWTQSAKIGPSTAIGVFGSGQPHPANLPPFPFLDATVINMHKNRAARPDYVIVSEADRAAWQTHPLRPAYREIANIGDRPSFGWFIRWRVPSESRIAARVYAPVQ